MGTKDGGVTYDVAYSLVTVSNGAPVTNTNSAYALADCKGCTTVAVSFQVVLVVGQSKDIAPINAAGALNYNPPACTTTAIADQIVVTLTAQPSQRWWQNSKPISNSWARCLSSEPTDPRRPSLPRSPPCSSRSTPS